MVDRQQLLAAYEAARLELLQRRESGGHWVGRLASSALSTATAVSALAIVRRHWTDASPVAPDKLTGLIINGVRWLAEQQNSDGGWGDTDRSHSNVATTMLAEAAFRLTGVPTAHADVLTRAEAYRRRQGGVKALRRRYGRDRTFAVPILTNAALAGMVSWSEVPSLPFELACVPQEGYRFLRLPVVSYAIPALVAIGQVRYFFRPPWNPFRRAVKRWAVEPSLRVLSRMQPESGGYLEAVPLTSFVAMSLAASGRADHEVTRRAVEFLVQSARPDGSWPIDTNLATWVTTLAANALAAGREEITEHLDVNWILSCQNGVRHPYTGAAPGGWGWSDLSGAVPDADDTAGALLALAHASQSRSLAATQRDRINEAARAGVAWLLDLQNRDGGWPTFCRGWGALPFDRSGTDLTAHALRALHAWRHLADPARIDKATRRGFDYLARNQRPDGSWVPLWFGNQDHPDEENPVYGTARVLRAYGALDRWDDEPARRARALLEKVQLPDGSWGAVGTAEGMGQSGSVEETALALEGLLSGPVGPRQGETIVKGLGWLVRAVLQGRLAETAPIGFYFAKLWYYEDLYPVVFAVAALGRALQHQLTPKPETPDRASLIC